MVSTLAFQASNDGSIPSIQLNQPRVPSCFLSLFRKNANFLTQKANYSIVFVFKIASFKPKKFFGPTEQQFFENEFKIINRNNLWHGMSQNEPTLSIELDKNELMALFVNTKFNDYCSTNTIGEVWIFLKVNFLRNVKLAQFKVKCFPITGS